MKTTALNKVHKALGAKMLPFAGFEMPIQYEGVNAEHETVRNAVGVFDVSHMGNFFVEGKDALPFLQYITSNDVSKLTPGKVQYSCFPNENNGIVDDLLVYQLDDDKYMLVVNGANLDKDWNWVTQHAKDFDVKLENLSDQYSILAVQGPKSPELMQRMAGASADLANLKYYTWTKADLAGHKDILVSATGYTGEKGYEIYVKNDLVEDIWNELFKQGADLGIKPIGLGARDTLRLEKGYCLYGNDIDDTTSPIEAGLGWITKFTKDFINSDHLKQQKDNGVSRKLVAFKLKDKGIARHGYDIVDENGQKIGYVTSGTMSPTLKEAIGMGYVTVDKAKAGSDILIQIRKKQVPAEVVKLPFV
ncbi:MAG TPA: glycine cleavage system aminomethyltransferase GcvT [Flavobacteriales bacterium]|nr:glycine cleavage system aminomethyltransferase GcvT [Flavobacteriales bacterium]